MCRYCHVLYDSCDIGINNKQFQVSDIINKCNDLDYKNYENKVILFVNENNQSYIDYHYKYIYNNIK